MFGSFTKKVKLWMMKNVIRAQCKGPNGSMQIRAITVFARKQTCCQKRRQQEKFTSESTSVSLQISERAALIEDRSLSLISCLTVAESVVIADSDIYLPSFSYNNSRHSVCTEVIGAGLWHGLTAGHTLQFTAVTDGKMGRWGGGNGRQPHFELFFYKETLLFLLTCA